nr:ABC transporter permease [Thermoleophilaceae bacterium]
QVAIDKASADRAKVDLGGKIKVSGEAAAKEFTVSGIATLGEVASFGGAAIAVLTLPEAQRMTSQEGELNGIAVQLEDGVRPERVIAALKTKLPRDLQVQTGEQNAAEQSDEIGASLGFLQTALLVFSFIALFVGGFIIFNTFSITVQQRSREFGLMRTLGATRRQILRSVILEALIVGVVASVLGLLAGIGLAEGLNALFKAAGIDLPKSGRVVATRTIVVSLLVGTLLTVLSSLSPALRATRVTPMEALRESALPPERKRRPLRIAVELLLAAAGIVLICIGLFGGLESDPALSMLGIGAVLVFVAVALLSPSLVKPIANGIGRPIEAVRGLTGRLARENSMRNPGRTAITAAALMVGLALVVFVTIFAAGLTSSIDDAIDQSLAGDITIQNANNFGDIPAASGPAVAKVPGVELVSPFRFGQSKVAGVSGKPSLSGINPATFPRVFKIDWVEGSDATLAKLDSGGTVIDEKFAKDNGLKVGDTLRITTALDRRLNLRVEGTFTDKADFAGDYYVSSEVMERDFRQKGVSLYLIGLAPGADSKEVQARIETILKRDFPTAEALDQSELKQKQRESLNQLLGLIYALLALAVLVSLFGIVNTLALSIAERTRELGMLRAIGMSRRQVRQTVRYESVITALIGGVLGLALGTFLAVLVSRPLESEGFSLSIPIGTLVLFMFLAA